LAFALSQTVWAGLLKWAKKQFILSLNEIKSIGVSTQLGGTFPFLVYNKFFGLALVFWFPSNSPFTKELDFIRIQVEYRALMPPATAFSCPLTLL